MGRDQIILNAGMATSVAAPPRSSSLRSAGTTTATASAIVGHAAGNVESFEQGLARLKTLRTTNAKSSVAVQRALVLPALADMTRRFAATKGDDGEFTCLCMYQVSKFDGSRFFPVCAGFFIFRKFELRTRFSSLRRTSVIANNVCRV